MNKSTVVFGTVLWAASGFAGVTVGYHEYGGVDVGVDGVTECQQVERLIVVTMVHGLLGGVEVIVELRLPLCVNLRARCRVHNTQCTEQ